MSLKAFHLVFITASALLAGAVAWWAIAGYRGEGGGSYLITAGLAGLAVVALVVYGRWFLAKLKDVSYL